MEVSEKGPNIKVLMYHRVLEEKPREEAHWHYVTISDFVIQMKMIQKFGFTPITFFDYQLSREGKLTLPAKPIIITFDDGYLDTFENALPVLLEMEMRAVIFVMGNRKITRAHWDEVDEDDNCPLMTDTQIQIVNNLGFEIGAHSLNHYSLIELSDEVLVKEVDHCKRAIEELIGDPITTFAYPYGAVDERVQRMVEKSGFTFACGVYTGSPRFTETTFDIRRLAVNQHTSKMNFALKLLTPFQYVEWIYHRVKTGKKKRQKVEVASKREAGETENDDKKMINPIFDNISNSKRI